MSQPQLGFCFVKEYPFPHLFKLVLIQASQTQCEHTLPNYVTWESFKDSQVDAHQLIHQPELTGVILYYRGDQLSIETLVGIYIPQHHLASQVADHLSQFFYTKIFLYVIAPFTFHPIEPGSDHYIIS